MSPRMPPLNITESPEFLADLLEQEKDEKRYQKIRTLYLLKTGQVKRPMEVARITKRHSTTIQFWIRMYRQGGLSKLLEDGYIGFSNFPDWAVDRLIEKFQDARFLPPIRDIQTWMLEELDIPITYGQLQRLLKSKVLPVQEVRANQRRQAQKAAIEGISEIKALPNVYEQFSRWRDERGFPNDTQALNQLMGEFFSIRAVHAVTPLQQPGKTLIESLAQEVLVTDIPYNIPDLLNQSRLAERLGVDDSTLSRERWRRTFPGWTKHHDPDKVGWLWVPELGKYRPLLSNDEIRAILLSPNERQK